MSQIERKTFDQPDEIRSFEKGKLELMTLGGVTFGRATLEPGWKWSTSIKPLVNTENCLIPHLQYLISGRLHVVMADGSQEDFIQGDVFSIPPGHDAWVVGQEPVVVLDVLGMAEYAKK
jgi:hypothetical protein